MRLDVINAWYVYHLILIKILLCLFQISINFRVDQVHVETFVRRLFSGCCQELIRIVKIFFFSRTEVYCVWLSHPHSWCRVNLKRSFHVGLEVDSGVSFWAVLLLTWWFSSRRRTRNTFCNRIVNRWIYISRIRIFLGKFRIRLIHVFRARHPKHCSFITLSFLCWCISPMIISYCQFLFWFCENVLLYRGKRGKFLFFHL